MNVDLTMPPLTETAGTVAQTDTSAYVTKTAPNYNREYLSIKGGTIAWNQLQPRRSSGAATDQYVGMFGAGFTYAVVIGHVYAVMFTQPAGCAVYRQSRLNFDCGYLQYQSPSVQTRHCFVTKSTSFAGNAFGAYLISKSTTTAEAYELTDLQLFDLTLMFGSTIADYIYNLEQQNTGDGVAWFRNLFPNDYYAYDAGSLQSVCTSEHSGYALDPIELRGIPKLTDGALDYDGDTYTADGTVTRNYGIVDLGTLNWEVNANFPNTFNGTTLPADANYISTSTVPNVVMANYVAKTSNTVGNSTERAVSIGHSKRIVYIKDPAYSDAATFKNAMSGVYLVYELATPTTETADAYTSPQVVNRPEVFTDYKVAQGTRDVAVPVGNETQYYNAVFYESVPLTMPTMSLPAISALSVDIDAVQDLNGYANPWVGGAGVNHVRLSSGYSQTLNGVTVEVTEDDEIWVHGTPDIESGYIPFQYVGQVDSSVIGNAVALSLSEKTVGVGFLSGSSNGGLNFTLSGTATVLTGTYTSGPQYLRVNVSYDVGHIDKKYKFQIELGSTATAWTPYENICPITGHTETVLTQTNGNTTNTYTIDLNGTRYGGTLDVLNGVLTVTHGIVDLGSLTWTYNSTYTRFQCASVTDARVESNSIPINAICSQYRVVGGYAVASTNGSIGMVTTPLLLVHDERYTDAATFKTAMSGVMLVYELATPTTVQLTAEQVETLLGTNTLSADTGDVSVTIGGQTYSGASAQFTAQQTETITLTMPD